MRQKTFLTKAGEPYLECHHLIMLKNKGRDEIFNIVALCPDCHRFLHYGVEGEVAEANRKLVEKLRGYAASESFLGMWGLYFKKMTLLVVGFEGIICLLLNQ